MAKRYTKTTRSKMPTIGRAEPLEPIEEIPIWVEDEHGVRVAGVIYLPATGMNLDAFFDRARRTVIWDLMERRVRFRVRNIVGGGPDKGVAYAARMLGYKRTRLVNWINSWKREDKEVEEAREWTEDLEEDAG